MGYPGRYETSHLCPYAHRRGAHDPDNRSALVGWRAGVSLPDGVGQCTRRAGTPYCRAGGCDEKTVRQLLHHSIGRGERRLPRGSSRHAPAAARAFPGERAEQLRALLHRCPRDFGHPTSSWTLDLAAEVSFAHGLTDHLVTGEAIRMTLLRLGIGGNAPSTGSPVPIQHTFEKKPTRPPDRGAATHPT